MKYICCCSSDCPPDPFCICYRSKVAKPEQKPKASIKHKENLCDQLKRFKKNSAELENILDLAKVIVKILKIREIEEYKLARSFNPILDSFVNFDEIPEDEEHKAKKKIRKAELKRILKNNCDMSKEEVAIVYSFVKYAFKTIYSINSFEDEKLTSIWREAAEKTIARIKDKNIIDTFCPCELLKLREETIKEYSDFKTRIIFRINQKDETNPCSFVQVAQDSAFPNPCREVFKRSDV